MPYSLGSRDRFTQTSSRYTLRKDFHLQLHINSYKNNLTLHKNVLLATFKVINCCNSKVAEVLKQKTKQHTPTKRQTVTKVCITFLDSILSQIK